MGEMIRDKTLRINLLSKKSESFDINATTHSMKLVQDPKRFFYGNQFLKLQYWGQDGTIVPSFKRDFSTKEGKAHNGYILMTGKNNKNFRDYLKPAMDYIERQTEIKST